MIVLDSSAVLAVLKNEPGGATVLSALKGALLSTVNAAEIHSRLLSHGLPASLSWSLIQGTGCEMCLFTEQHAKTAAELVASTKRLGLSLGDRACLALAIERQAKVYTADKAWKSLELGIQVEVIR